MKNKTSNLLLIFLSLFGTIVFLIPVGIKNDWPLWLFILTIAVLCITMCVTYWNTGSASFKTIDKMPGKFVAFHFLPVFLMILGFDFIIGSFGSSHWLVLVGLAIVITVMIFERYQIHKYYKSGPDFPSHLDSTSEGVNL